MGKVYLVFRTESGEYIGHGLYEENDVLAGVFDTRKMADDFVKEKGGYPYYVREVEYNKGVG